ncbi:hypothetical protein ACHAWF_014103 [Thalassiosira exigua]
MLISAFASLVLIVSSTGSKLPSGCELAADVSTDALASAGTQRAFAEDGTAGSLRAPAGFRCRRLDFSTLFAAVGLTATSSEPSFASTDSSMSTDSSTIIDSDSSIRDESFASRQNSSGSSRLPLASGLSGPTLSAPPPFGRSEGSYFLRSDATFSGHLTYRSGSRARRSAAPPSNLCRSVRPCPGFSSSSAPSRPSSSSSSATNSSSTKTSNAAPDPVLRRNPPPGRGGRPPPPGPTTVLAMECPAPPTDSTPPGRGGRPSPCPRSFHRSGRATFSLVRSLSLARRWAPRGSFSASSSASGELRFSSWKMSNPPAGLSSFFRPRCCCCCWPDREEVRPSPRCGCCPPARSFRATSPELSEFSASLPPSSSSSSRPSSLV